MKTSHVDSLWAQVDETALFLLMFLQSRESSQQSCLRRDVIDVVPKSFKSRTNGFGDAKNKDSVGGWNHIVEDTAVNALRTLGKEFLEMRFAMSLVEICHRNERCRTIHNDVQRSLRRVGHSLCYAVIMESAGHDECPIANAEKEVNLLQLRMMKIDR